MFKRYSVLSLEQGQGVEQKNVLQCNCNEWEYVGLGYLHIIRQADSKTRQVDIKTAIFY